MILFFHFLCLLARYIVINFSKSIRQKRELLDDTIEKEAMKCMSRSYLKDIREVKQPVYENGTIKFFPPIYVQRYETVAIILQKFAEDGIIRKVVDFGCAELGLFSYLKKINGISIILEVDINESILERNAYKAAPLTTDYLMSKGITPLDVYLLAGSVGDYDDHLAGCDTVICIELIEHLSEDVFYKMPYTIFHQIKPRVAIFTTPNADFNALFPNFQGMRHEDHKFEWSRIEFYYWSQGIISQYPEYSVRFYGVGAGPEGTENLGCCTQLAVFRRSDDIEPFSSAREELEGVHNYKLVKHYKYPVFVDTRTTEEKVLHEVQYQMSYFSTLSTYYNFEENETEIPLSVLKQFVEDFNLDDEEFLKILMDGGLDLKNKEDGWYLIWKEQAGNSSDTSFEEGDWLNIDICHGFCGDESEKLEENWDTDGECRPEEDIAIFQTARSLEEPNSPERMRYTKEEDKTRSAPSSSNKLNTLVNNSVGSSGQQIVVKSKIPRKMNLLRTTRKTTPEVRKSHSLDSCIENINRMSDVESYFNLISGRLVTSGRSKRESGSSLYSSSIERAGDSGYPFSFSPPDADLTPEQVDELFTESRSTSPSTDVDDVIPPRPQPLIIVENGDLANNNRDGEGNNVEGLMGQRLINERDPNDNMFFPEIGEFPPWLLNLGDLARPIFIPVDFPDGGDDDEGVGDDTSSDSNQSLDPDESDVYFDQDLS